MVLPQDLPLDIIEPSPEALRKLDEEAVCDLAKSIQANGLLQPILVRPVGSSYEIVFGNHRAEACRRLGWKSIPAIIKQMSSDESFLTKLVENLQRNNEIDPLAEARGYIALIDHGWTINSIAKRIGKSDSYVSDRVGLIRRLHSEIARRFHENVNGHIKPSHLELLARMRPKAYQLELSELVEKRRLSVRRLELLISSRQPLRETVQGNADSLYIQIPPAIAVRMGIEAGSQVYEYMQTKRKLVIETLRESSPPKHRISPTATHSFRVRPRNHILNQVKKDQVRKEMLAQAAT